jgi:hypothetical protein
MKVGYWWVIGVSDLEITTAMPSSSCNLRERHSSGRSPSLILPPGNSHFSGKLMASLRCVESTLPSFSMIAHVT